MSAPERLLSGLAGGLRRRVLDRSGAEARLADFAFREGAGGAGQPALDAAAWRYFIARTLAAAGEPGTLDLLERLSSGDATLESLARSSPGGPDAGLVTVDRIGGLAGAGLVRRDLETGRVGLTTLGSAVLALVQDWERLAAMPGQDDRRPPR